MFSHGDTASDPAEISTASSNTEFLAALPKHYLTCTFPRLGVGFVCLDKVSRTMYRQEKGLIFAILVFTIPFESSIDVSFFPKAGEGRDPPQGKAAGKGKTTCPKGGLGHGVGTSLSLQLLPSLWSSLPAMSQMQARGIGY